MSIDQMQLVVLVVLHAGKALLTSLVAGGASSVRRPGYHPWNARQPREVSA